LSGGAADPECTIIFFGGHATARHPTTRCSTPSARWRCNTCSRTGVREMVDRAMIDMDTKQLKIYGRLPGQLTGHTGACGDRSAALGRRRVGMPGRQAGVLDHVLALLVSEASRTLKVVSIISASWRRPSQAVAFHVHRQFRSFERDELIGKQDRGPDARASRAQSGRTNFELLAGCAS